MKAFFKRFILLAFALGLALIIGTSCHKFSDSSVGGDVLTIGTFGPDLDIWQYIADSDQAKEAGLKIEPKEVDGLDINEATLSGDLTANGFQTVDYLDNYNKEHNCDLTVAFTTNIEPMGIYSKKYQTLEEVPDGAKVAIANNPAQNSRALVLLQSAGLIKLTDEKKDLYTQEDIVENPKNLNIKEVDDTNGIRLLDDLDLVTITSTLAAEGGLNPMSDSLYHEDADTITADNVGNVNVLVVPADKKDDPRLKQLHDIYHSQPVQDYVESHLSGSKILVDMPVDQIKDLKAQK